MKLQVQDCLNAPKLHTPGETPTSKAPPHPRGPIETSRGVLAPPAAGQNFLGKGPLRGRKNDKYMHNSHAEWRKFESYIMRELQAHDMTLVLLLVNDPRFVIHDDEITAHAQIQQRFFSGIISCMSQVMQEQASRECPLGCLNPGSGLYHYLIPFDRTADAKKSPGKAGESQDETTS